MLRVPAEVHAAVAAAAEASGKSINQWAASALDAAIHRKSIPSIITANCG